MKLYRRWEVRSTKDYRKHRVQARFFTYPMALRYASYLNVLAGIEGYDAKFYLHDRKTDDE